ncbi:Peroxiredoxin Q [Mycena kentingensis (nom. inval.)]|nr:Peroxiredoxin Q [Mycena kentingensis (nom. inval.)]
MSHQSLHGKPAPPLTLTNYDGTEFKFEPGSKGIPTALFFYPEAGSYGCTKEACQFRDARAEKDTFGAGKVEIIGISPDSVEKQKAFVEKNKLTYPVLSDSNGDASKAYGVGKGLFGILKVARVTFIIDAKGVVRDSVEGTLNFGAHSKFVAKWLETLEAEKKKPAAAEPVAPGAEEPTPAAALAPST